MEIGPSQKAPESRQQEPVKTPFKLRKEDLPLPCEAIIKEGTVSPKTKMKLHNKIWKEGAGPLAEVIHSLFMKRESQ